MQVETYEITETTSDGKVDMLDEQAVALVNQLGLKGQQTLIERSGTATPILLPYQQMTADEQGVYMLLFPTRTPVANYDCGPIPVRVLQVIAFAANLFDSLEVWHPSTRVKDDPILVGQKGDRWSGKRYLLARWGDALKPFAELVKMAAASARDRLQSRLARAKAEVEQDLAVLASIGDGYAIAWENSSPTYLAQRPSNTPF